MDTLDPQSHYEAALEMAADAREKYREDGCAANFRAWREASEIAIKWNRAVRLDAGDRENFDQGLERLMRGK